MGWFQRLFSGAPDQDGPNRDPRSPDQARVSAEDFTQELRALKDEIKLLRETLGEGGRAVSGGNDSSRSRRSRGRGRGGSSRDRDRDRDQGGNGKGGRRDQSQRRSLPKAPPDDAPVGLLVDYLKTRGVVVYEGQDDLNRNEAFEHLARHLGTHFDLLAEFYEKVKRCVATGRGQRIDIDNYSQAARSAAVQFGTLLHRHGMLKDFYYHRSPKKQLRVIPTKDGQIGQFLTGGWLEIYVSAVLSKRLRAAMSSAKFQMLYNVKGVLPDGREFEADLMAAVGDKFFWLECKTGNWQDYSARFRGLVKIFGVDRTSGGLLLIRPPDAATRARATDMLEMTLLSLADVDDFISVFLGEEPTGDSRRHAPAPSKDLLEPQSEEEIPLENAPPARKLGQVDLDGKEDSEEQAPTARRRRRRRGGRGRGRRRAAEGAASEEAAASAEGEDAKSDSKEGTKGRSNGARAPKGSLHEPLPIEKFEDESGEPKEEASGAEEPVAAEAETKAEGETSESSESKDKPSRSRRRRRRASPFADADGEAKEGAGDSGEAAEAKAESEESAEAKSEETSEPAKPKRKRSRSRKPKAEAVKPEAEAEESVAEVAEVEEAAQPEAVVVAEEPEAPVAEEVVAEEPAEEEAEEEAPIQEKKSASGVTIAPDLLAMMAGSPKASEDKKD